MNGYSKINNVTGSGHKSRSIDFSDIFSFPAQTQKQSKNTTSTDDDADESGKGEQFGVILGRSTSVSSSSAPGMKRTFSVRRSSSVSERYCRIHDADDSTTDDIDHLTAVKMMMKKKHRGGGKILRACKRFLRF